MANQTALADFIRSLYGLVEEDIGSYRRERYKRKRRKDPLSVEPLNPYQILLGEVPSEDFVQPEDVSMDIQGLPQDIQYGDDALSRIRSQAQNLENSKYLGGDRPSDYEAAALLRASERQRAEEERLIDLLRKKTTYTPGLGGGGVISMQQRPEDVGMAEAIMRAKAEEDEAQARLIEADTYRRGRETPQGPDAGMIAGQIRKFIDSMEFNTLPPEAQVKVREAEIIAMAGNPAEALRRYQEATAMAQAMREGEPGQQQSQKPLKPGRIQTMPTGELEFIE